MDWRAPALKGFDRSPLVVDTAIAVFLFAYSAVEVLAAEPSTSAVAVHLLSVAVASLPLAVRRTLPLVSTLGVAVGLLLDSLVTVPVASFGQFVTAMLVVYSLTVHATRRVAAVGGTALGVALAVFIVRDPDHASALDAAETVGALLVWVAVGMFVRHRRDQAAADTRRAAAEERTRIARELHDLVGHTVSLMTVQAGVARVALEAADTPRTFEAIGAVETSGRAALDELRRVLGILRPAGDHGDGLAPQPGIGAIEDLTAQTRQAGLPVELQVHGEVRPVTAGVGLAAYRIVQEALTNVRKHAGQAQATVTLDYRSDLLRIEVADDGTGPGARLREGHGLGGMRERTALYGGRLEVRAATDRGFVVTADLPLGEAATT